MPSVVMSIIRYAFKPSTTLVEVGWVGGASYYILVVLASVSHIDLGVV